ncbi:hypothetical protein [Dactylosporangium sp. NPDC005555]|uniref:hypothetical protein n=1 Tax=Dactylosporangium sp. NPDC005555 TaxID=3154889 RepID=UPI0033BC4C79
METFAAGDLRAGPRAGRHVTRIVHRYARATGKPGPRLFPLAPWEELVATYDDTGLLRLASQPSGEVRYERPPSGFTIDAACALVRRSLVTQIPAVVADLPVDGPACCVSLTYSSSHPLDVMLRVVSAEERKSLIAEYTGNRTIVDGRPWIGDFWTFGDEPGEEPVDLSTVADTVRLLTQELSLAADDRGRRLLCAVAAELNTHDWSRVLPITDDFVVYAVDLEMADLERNLPACLRHGPPCCATGACCDRSPHPATRGAW